MSIDPVQLVTTEAGDGQPESPLRVLVVEDSKANQLLLKAMLVKLGYEVILADDGLQAVEKARCGDLDVILMDVQMPNLDGLAAAAMIRRLDPHGRMIPILALTGNGLEYAEINACLSAGMDEVLAKPIEADLLRQKLAGIFSRG